MATALPVGGIDYVTIDGTSYEAVDDVSFDLGGFTRETAKSLTGIDGFFVSPKEGMIELSLRYRPGIDVEAFNTATSVTVTIGLRNGAQVIGTNCWLAEPVVVNAKESVLKATFNSATVTVA